MLVLLIVVEFVYSLFGLAIRSTLMTLIVYDSCLFVAWCLTSVVLFGLI